MKIKTYIADILFILGNRLVMLSAKIMGYDDVVMEMKKNQAHWLKTDAFKVKKD
jgi:hypothetical protein